MSLSRLGGLSPLERVGPAGQPRSRPVVPRLARDRAEMARCETREDQMAAKQAMRLAVRIDSAVRKNCLDDAWIGAAKKLADAARHCRAIDDRIQSLADRAKEKIEACGKHHYFDGLAGATRAGHAGTVRVESRDSTERGWSYEGHFLVEEMRSANKDDREVIAWLRSAKPGDQTVGGGGAAPEYRLTLERHRRRRRPID